MKKFIGEFCKRGLVAAAGGPVILAIIYGILGYTGVIDSLTPAEVTKGILSITLMAFIAAGITAVYGLEQLPLLSAILLHAGVLYLDYLIMYLLNNWLAHSAIGIFSAIFAAGYILVWLCIYAITKAKTDKLNRKLQK